MTTRHWLIWVVAFAALAGVACLCSYSLTRTGDAFPLWLSTTLVLLGVAFTGILEHVEGAASWSSRRYAFTFMALFVPVTLISKHAGPVVGASVIGSRCAVKAAHIAHATWRYLRRPAA